MSIATLQNQTARIFTISTSRNSMSGIVNTSVFREAVPVRRYKRNVKQGAGDIAGEDGIDRAYRLIFQPDVVINQTDYIYIDGEKHDEGIRYDPGGQGNHLEVDVRNISGRSS